MMDFARFAGLDDQPQEVAEPGPHQVVVNRRRAQKSRDGDPFIVDRTVAEHQDVVAFPARPLGLVTNRVERRTHTLGAFVRGIGEIEGDGSERVIRDLADRADLFQVLVGEDGLAHLETFLRRRIVDAEEVGPRADQ